MLGLLKRIKASADVRRLRRGDDGSASAYADLCRRLIAQGRWAEALAVAREGVRARPRSPELQDQARLLWKRVDADAYRALVAEADTGGDDAGVRLVDHLLEAGELDLAIGAADRLVAAEPASPAAAEAAAEALCRRFERDLTRADGLAALAALRRARELAPDDGDVAARFGGLLAAIGAAGAAREVFATAAAAHPDDPRFSATDAARASEASAEDADEESLLARIERDDALPSAVACPFVPDAESAAAVDAELAALVAIAGVRRVAWVADGQAASANADGVRRGAADADPFASFASALRAQAGTASKRLGAGAAQEIELLGASRLAVFLGVRGALAVDLDPRLRSETVAARCREFVARREAGEARA